jgi:hypothetical protein
MTSQQSGNTFNFANASHNRVAVGNENIQLDNVHGQNLIIGGRRHQQQPNYGQPAQIAEADLAVLQRIFAGLRAQIAAEASDDKKTAALERIDELEDAIATSQPDISTMEYVKNWFNKQMPTFAGAVTSIVVHPIVGKIVEAAGEVVASDFRKRFGNAPS